jgi:hypothetical protein
VKRVERPVVAEPAVYPSEGAGAVSATRSSSIAALLTGHVLRDGETVLLVLKPSLWFIVFNTFRTALAVVVLYVAARLLGDRFGVAVFSQKFVLLETAIFIVAGRVMYAIMQWMGRLYVLTDQRVIRLAGVFNVDVSDCPLRKIAQTEVTASIREKLVACGTVEIQPSDSAVANGCQNCSWQTIADPEDVNAQIQQAIRRAAQ